MPLSLDAALRKGAAALAKSSSPALDARVLMKHLLGVDDAALIARGYDILPQETLAAYERLIDRRSKCEPVAYITGEQEFWSLSFQVSPDVLIPRQDSECLIEAALARREREQSMKILDLGTGSGCLLCALLTEFTHAEGVGVDRSAAAVKIAQDNANRLGVGPRGRFVRGDWGEGLLGGFDLIIANPPYIRDDAQSELSPEVIEYEPSTALFAGADGLDAYRVLLSDISRLLGEQGLLLLEIGEKQADSVADMVTKYLPKAPIDILSDLAGRPRGVVADRRKT